MQGKELSGEGGVEEGLGGAEEEADKGQEEGEVNGRKERIGGNERGNQSPKGIIRSAVPLPCSFDVVKSQRVAGQRPLQETKSCRIG